MTKVTTCQSEPVEDLNALQCRRVVRQAHHDNATNTTCQSEPVEDLNTL
jgi:hypothetical protein